MALAATIFYAVQYICRLPVHSNCAIIFDSMYAAYTVRQSWRAKSDLALVRHVGSTVHRVSGLVDLQWHWVGTLVLMGTRPLTISPSEVPLVSV